MTWNQQNARFMVAATAALAMICLPLAASAEGPLAAVESGGNMVTFSPMAAYGEMTLTVSGGGRWWTRSFSGGEAPFFRLGDGDEPIADGYYRWELTASPRGRDIPADSSRGGSEDTNGRRANAVRGEALAPQSGGFRVLNGQIVNAGAVEAGSAGSAGEGGFSGGGESGPRSRAAGGPETADQQILDDLIVVGSACVGQDCTNGESFGFDTLRLKENNLRIKFQDTSTSASFPSNDWQLTANDSSNGGANKFSIDDISASRTPFTIEAGARTNALFVEDGGRIGLGTSTPVVALHIQNGNTPTVRLHQDGSSGFGQQIWDVAGNEANFFIRDASNGSTLPFRIFPDAPSNALNVEGSTGDIGLGTTSPDSSLHVRRTGGSDNAKIKVESAGNAASEVLLELAKPAGGQLTMSLAQAARTWNVAILPGGTNDFIISDAGDADVEFRIDESGDVTIPAGSMYLGSDRNRKEAIVPVDAESVLTRLAEVPISTWEWTDRDTRERHLGPMAQDFAAAFGLGADETTIAPMDMSGVALAAAQALNERLEASREQIATLEAEKAAMAERLEALEAAVDSLANDR